MQGDDLVNLAKKNANKENKRNLVKQALEKYALALKDLDVAINLDPQYQPARRHRGNVIVAVYRARRSVDMPVNDILDKAIADLTIAAALDFNSVTAANSLGEAYLLKGRYSEAVTHFTRAIQLNPTYASSYNGRCQARAKQNEWTLARSNANSAAARNSDFAEKHCLR